MNTNKVTSRSADWETIAVAVILMATGFVLLGGDAFGILSLDHIQNLWPVSLIVVGVVDWFSSAENSGMVTNK
ncbi:MAG TPA: hypothetical protein VMF91_24795 [Bryobacteraceae bacterium]|nr:hypothetical protein [Bryobacteraceae bacterium]